MMGWLKQALVLFVAILFYQIYTRFRETSLPPIVEGNFHPDFREVANVFRKLVESGHEKGASFAVYYRGKPVVDMWGGYVDQESEQRWRNDTITLVFSCTKGVAAIVAAMLADRGYLDYQKLVSHYWPGFAKNGKENITVEMLLSHQAGLITTNETVPLHWLNSDPERLEQFLENQTPTIEPGSGIVYHAITYGLYLDRLLPKIDPKGRSVKQMFEEDIAKEFDIDFSIGSKKSEDYRFAPLVAMFRNPEIRQVPLVSSMGHGNARSLAKLYGILANGGQIDGKHMLSQEMIHTLNTPVVSKNSLDLHRLSTYGLGVIFFDNPQGGKVFGHTGYGGQMANADLAHNLGLAYITNHLSEYTFGDDPKYLALQKATYNCLQKHSKRYGN
ncbi:beta-lactamase domain-containing protein 2-like [Pecten maximus]|uniref:beta-lactamase domain-containing protein 2-like n=1 Tax=Pecten maximus TaxID=6579 RepID=UPI0014581E29|nr:beta-lactamase domain-containing protein 2-like [Pecten maximus]